MSAFTIPSIFTAVDKFSAPVKAMSRNLDAFANKAEASVARNERMFRKLTPALGETSKQMLSFASSAAIAGGVVAGIAFSGKSLTDYENELANLQAVTGASGKDFDLFKSKIKSVAQETKSSAVDVAQAFTAIANNQPELLKDADALSKVTQSSIMLAKASKMDLKPAGEAVTQILNQYGKGAAEAAKTVDILAAGSVAGSSEIRDTADAIQKFGTVAANAGIKIDESVALIELASKFEKGAEAGSKLRNILITMSTAKVQDPKAVKDMQRLGVNMEIVSNKALPLNVRLKEMAKVAKDDAALFHIFGKENQALATGVLANVAAFGGMVDAVHEPGLAAKMAAKNTETFTATIAELKNKFVTWLVTSDEAAQALSVLKSGVLFLANHFTTIIKIIGVVIGAFALWKTWIIANKIAIVAMRAVSTAFFLVDMIQYVASTNGISIAQAAWSIVTTSCTEAVLALNAAMLANPIGIVIAALVALVAVLYSAYKHYQMLEEIYQKSAAASKATAIQKEKGEVEKLSASYQKLGMSVEQADARATAERVGNLTKTSAVLKSEAGNSLQKAVAENTGMFGAVTSLFNGSPEIKNFDAARGALEASEGAKKELLNPKAAEQDSMVEKMISTNNANVNIKIDDPNNRTSAKSDQDFVSIKTSSTLSGN